MIILTIRTDKPEAEVGLYEDATKTAYETWHAHRALAETLHQKITSLLTGNGKSLKDIDGIVCYKGPGSFTGLRIGLSIANALAYSLRRPIVGETGEQWIETGCARLTKGETETVAMPEYGADVHITVPKH